MVENTNGSRLKALGILLICIGAIFVGLYTAVEAYIITRPNNNRDAEASSGTFARRNFLIAVSVASFTRVASLVALVICNYYQLEITTKAINQYNSKLTKVSLFLPTCIYITMYTMITLYFAQMCYMVSVNSVPFFQLRRILVLGNVATYFLILFFTLVMPLESVVYSVLFVSFILLLVSISFYGFSLHKLLPRSTAQQLLVKRITSRFFPLMSICVAGLFIGTAYYLCMCITLRGVRPTASRQCMYDLIIFSLTEVLPSLLIVILISKRNSSNGVTSTTEDLRGGDSSSRLTQILKSYISSKLMQTTPKTYNSIPTNDATKKEENLQMRELV